MLPEPFPIYIKPRAAPPRSPVHDVLCIRGIQKTDRWVAGNVFPLSVLRVAVSEGETIAARMILGGDVRIPRSCQIALQITVIESVHGFVAKHPSGRDINTTRIQIGFFSEQPPTAGHCYHLLELACPQRPFQVPHQARIHPYTADSVAVIRRDVVSRALVNLRIGYVRTQDSDLVSV